jgi:hypothetical protein
MIIERGEIGESNLFFVFKWIRFCIETREDLMYAKS